MPKLDGQEIAKIFDPFVTAVRDYVKTIEDLIDDAIKRDFKLIGVEDVDARAMRARGLIKKKTLELGQKMVQPLERIRDEASKCRSPTELESVVDSLIKLFQDTVRFVKAELMNGRSPDLDMWNQYLRNLAALALEINDYCLKQYFPMQRDLARVKIKVSKGFRSPAPRAPIKVYFDSDYFQYFFTTNKGEALFQLPKGKEFTFWASKDGEEVSKSMFLSGDTEIKL